MAGWVPNLAAQNDGPFDLTKTQNLPLEPPVKMIVLDAIAKALADVIDVKRLGGFSLISRLYSYFHISRWVCAYELVAIFAAVKFCLSEGVHADTRHWSGMWGKTQFSKN